MIAVQTLLLPKIYEKTPNLHIRKYKIYQIKYINYQKEKNRLIKSYYLFCVKQIVFQKVQDEIKVHGLREVHILVIVLSNHNLFPFISNMLGFDFGKAANFKHYTTWYEQLSKIGEGGFSKVFKVKSKLDNKLYAMKQVKIKPSLYKHDLNQYFEKIRNEASHLSELKHPNIVGYHGCWIEAEAFTQEEKKMVEQESEDDLSFQIVIDDDCSNSGIEFIHESKSQKKYDQPKQEQKNQNKIAYEDCLFGFQEMRKYKEITLYYQTQLGQYSLQDYIAKRNFSQGEGRSLPASVKIENYKFILEMINGLTYIHDHKIIHRDLKLQNVILTKDKHCKIIDFGLAKKVRNSFSVDVIEIKDLEDDLEKFSSSVGTKIYSSPQQASSNKYDHRTDIYSLAMMIVIMFSKWFTCHEERQLLLNIRNRTIESQNIDKRLKDLLIKCLKQEKQRPSLEQLRKCVKNLLKQQLLTQQRNKILSNTVENCRKVRNGFQKIEKINVISIQN